MEQIRNFDQLLQAALAHGRKGIAVAAPYDKNTLLAVKDALASGLAAPQLFGDVERMLPLLEQVQLDAGAVKLTDVRDTAQAIDAAIESIRSGENQILMKGTVSTGTLLKHALDRTRGLNIGRLASHLIVLQIPGLDRLLISTDGGLNIAPTLTEKADILRNAIDVARALGIETPKAACLAAVETVNPKMQATVDAACLCKMADRGAFPGAVVEGPLAMDNILSAEAARKKGIDSPVPGHADIILAPSIEVANTFSKTLNYLMHSSNAGIVMGAAAPIILPSRARRPGVQVCLPGHGRAAGQVKNSAKALSQTQSTPGASPGGALYFCPALSRVCPGGVPPCSGTVRGGFTAGRRCPPPRPGHRPASGRGSAAWGAAAGGCAPPARRTAGTSPDTGAPRPHP